MNYVYADDLHQFTAITIYSPHLTHVFPYIILFVTIRMYLNEQCMHFDCINTVGFGNEASGYMIRVIYPKPAPCRSWSLCDSRGMLNW